MKDELDLYNYSFDYPMYELTGNILFSCVSEWVQVMMKEKMDPEIRQIYHNMLYRRKKYKNNDRWDFNIYFELMVDKLKRRYR